MCDLAQSGVKIDLSFLEKDNLCESLFFTIEIILFVIF